MAYNGSGIFNRIYNWVNDANASVNITASRMDTEDSGFATGLSNCICKDGQTTITQNIPFNGKKITGLGAGTGATDAAQIGQVQAGQLNWVAAGGTADALTAVYSPVNTALTDGLILFVRASAANATTTPTFAPDGLTAHTITKIGGTALAANDIAAANHEIILRYNLANTRWELLNPGHPANADIIAAVLTGYSSGAGTVASTDTILQAVNKLNGNIALKAALATNTFSGAQIGGVTALTSSSNSIAINLALNNNFSHTFTESTTLANPSNPVAGQSGCIAFTQHASSAKTLAYGSQWIEATTGTAPTVSTTVGTQNLLSYYVFDTTHIYYTLNKHGVT